MDKTCPVCGNPLITDPSTGERYCQHCDYESGHPTSVVK